MDRLGFGVKEVMEIVKDRPRGIIFAQGNAFSFHGPYASAAGYEVRSAFVRVNSIAKTK
jgi:hypothetical protein